MSSSDVTIIPERFCGFRVLLVEHDMMSLQKHACLLKRSSYQVTITTEASAGLSMITNGQTFDCLLIDGDLCETDMEPFLHQVWSHQPQMSIIVMAAYDTHLRIPKESLESGAVLCLLRPSCFTDICNIWKHICRNKISSEENVSRETLHKEDQVDNNIPWVNPRVEPSAINGSTVINNNVLSGNFTAHQALGINSQHDVTFWDLFPKDGDDVVDQEDVEEIIQKENIGISATRKDDKGKQPLIPKRKHNQLPVEDDKHPIKKGRLESRISWKGELEDKFQKALKELGEQATSKEILIHMNVLGLTRHHVASHQQKHRNRLRSLEANIAELTQKGTEFQVEGVANEIFRHPIWSDEIAPVTESSSILRLPELNLKGILYMLIENIRNILQRVAPPLPVPQPTITPYHNYGGDLATVHSSRGKGIEIQQTGHDNANAVVPLVTSESSSHHAFGEATAPLGGNQAADHSFGMVENSNSGGQGTAIQLTGHEYGNPVDPMVPGKTSSHHAFGEAMAPLGGDQRTTHNIRVIQNSNNGGQGTRIQLMGHDYANAVDPLVTGETSSHHAFGEAMAPLGGGNYGGDQPTIHNIGVVENSSSGGQGTRIQLVGHDYGNAVMDPMVTSETSSHHAFGEAMAPIGSDNYGGYQTTTHSFGVVKNSNSSGQGTQIQLTSHDYGNAMEPHVSGEISGQHAFGEAMSLLGGDQTTAHSFQVVENFSSGGRGFGNTMQPHAVSGEISSQHAFVEVMAPLGVGAAKASDNNLGIDFNSLLNGVDNNGILGDASGSGFNEVKVQLLCFRPEPDQVADFGGIEILKHNPEDLDSPDVFSLDAGDLYPSQDV